MHLPVSRTMLAGKSPYLKHTAWSAGRGSEALHRPYIAENVECVCLSPQPDTLKGSFKLAFACCRIFTSAAAVQEKGCLTPNSDICKSRLSAVTVNSYQPSREHSIRRTFEQKSVAIPF